MYRARIRKTFARSFFAGSIALLAAASAPAQTNLGPGDVALIGWVDNGSPNDIYSLVALADLPAGTTLYFTDNGWISASGGFRNTNGPNDGNGNETLAMLTVQTAIPAGTILDTTQTSSPSFTWTTSGPIPGASSGTFGSLVLTQSGDQVYVFQDDDGQNPLNVGTKVHLFVLDDTGTFEDATTTGEGNVPPGLSEAGHTALTLSQFGGTQNFMAFNTTALAHGTRDEWLAAIHDPANWTVGTTGVLPSGSIAVDPPGVSAFCFGDGSANACPCGNNGLPGRGCDNSARTGGALLAALGSPNPDTLAFHASGMPARTTVLFQQTNSHVNTPASFGDGLRCTSGSRIKLAQRRTLNGSARYPDVGDPSVSVRSAQLGDPLQPGMLRYYSVVYRDTDIAFCPAPQGASFNVTNAIRVAW